MIFQIYIRFNTDIGFDRSVEQVWFLLQALFEILNASSKRMS